MSPQARSPLSSHLFKYDASSFVKNVIALPERPARPVRPILWI